MKQVMTMKKEDKKPPSSTMYGCGCSCGTGLVSTKEIDLDGRKVKIKGLKETFRAYENIIDPEKTDGDRLLSALKAVNDIPEAEEKKFKKAILKEYKKYCGIETS